MIEANEPGRGGGGLVLLSMDYKGILRPKVDPTLSYSIMVCIFYARK